MARVTKPCPACKGTNFPRAADGICSECQRIIAWAKMRQADDKKKNGEEISVITKEVYYALPHYRYEHGYIAHDIGDRLSRAMHALIMTMTRKGGSYDTEIHVPEWLKDHPSGSSIYDWKMAVVMRKDQAEAVNALDKAFRSFITAVSETSYEEGRNLLLSIAAGKISMDELNSEHTKKG